MNETNLPNENASLQRFECPMCGSKRVRDAIETEVFEYGSGSDVVELKAQVPLHTCTQCDFEFTNELAEIRRHEAVCNYLGILTPNEITSLRNRLGMTRAKLSDLTSLGEASLGRWERGALFQNKACDKLLRLLQYEENICRLQVLEEDPVEVATPVRHENITNSAFHVLDQEAEKEKRKCAQIFALHPTDREQQKCM